MKNINISSPYYSDITLLFNHIKHNIFLREKRGGLGNELTSGIKNTFFKYVHENLTINLKYDKGKKKTI